MLILIVTVVFYQHEQWNAKTTEFAKSSQHQMAENLSCVYVSDTIVDGTAAFLTLRVQGRTVSRDHSVQSMAVCAETLHCSAVMIVEKCIV